MLKKTAVLFMFLSLFSSCATVKQPIDTVYWNFNKIETFIPENLYSSDDAVKVKATAIFSALPDESKRKVLTYLAYTLSDEKDPVIRTKTFEALTEFKAGTYVIVPLIESAKENGSKTIFMEVKAFISTFDRSKIEIKSLTELLKDTDYNVSITAARTLGLISKRAEKTLPEIFAAMHMPGNNEDHYAEFYNAASMINPKIAITQVIIDLKDPDKNISRNSITKLLELYTYLSKDSPIRKDIFFAFVRMMYSDDKDTSIDARETIASMGDEESQQAIKAYIAMGKLALRSMSQMADKKLTEKFKHQEEDLYDEMTVFYRLIGREDAVAGLKK